MDRLSGLDASFLYLETPAQLMHVCGLIVLDPSTMPDGYSFDAHAATGSTAGSATSPTFTRKLRRVPLGLDHPVWVRDKHSTSSGTCTGSRCRSPGGYAELTELAATSPACRSTAPGRCGRCG